MKPEYFSTRAIAEYLRAEHWLTAAMKFGPNRPIAKEESSALTVIEQLEPIMLRVGPSVTPLAYIKPNVVERALTVLSVLELATRTRFFDFVREDPPIKAELIRKFARSKIHWFNDTPCAGAADFITRYIYGFDLPESSELGGDTDLESLSYGEICGFLELAEQFINSDRIHRFIVGLERRYPLIALIQLGGAVGNLLIGQHPNQGKIDFFEFTLDIDHLTDLEKMKDRSGLHRLTSECFSLWAGR